MCFSYSTQREITRGLKRIWDSKMGTPSLARIIQYGDLALKALEIVYRENGDSVEGLADRSGTPTSDRSEERRTLVLP